MIFLPDHKGYQNNDYIIADGELAPRSALDAIMEKDRCEVYEVVRIKDGKPVTEYVTKKEAEAQELEDLENVVPEDSGN